MHNNYCTQYEAMPKRKVPSFKGYRKLDETRMKMISAGLSSSSSSSSSSTSSCFRDDNSSNSCYHCHHCSSNSSNSYTTITTDNNKTLIGSFVVLRERNRKVTAIVRLVLVSRKKKNSRRTVTATTTL